MSKATLLVVIVAWSGARAEVKNKRTQDVAIDVVLSARSKPLAAHKDNAAAKPTFDASALLGVEIAIDDIRGEQERALLDLIRATPDDDPDKADLLFRLGEIYAKQQRAWRLAATEAELAGATRDAAAHADKAKQAMVKAVRVYAQLTSRDTFRNYAKMDTALFYFGYTLTGAHYMKEARAVYDKLLENYPASKYVPVAHFAFGEYFFETNQLADAEARYKAVLKFPKSPLYWYAMYKLGWIDLNQSRFQGALETFFQVANATKRAKQDEVLNRAAKKDFVRAYAEVGKADKAHVAFTRVDAAYAFDMLQILADLYLAQGKSDKAIYVYRELMTTQPKHKNVCLWQYDVAHAMLSLPGAALGDRVREIEQLARLWGALKTKRVLPDAERAECRDNAAAMAGEYARAYHSEAAKTKNGETLAYAQRLYEAYLAAFPDADDVAQARYFYAELLWLRAESANTPRAWEIAAAAFTGVVETGKLGAKLAKVSAYAAVLAWRNALDIDPRTLGRDAEREAEREARAGAPLAPKPIPEREQKLLAAFELYIKHVDDPDDDELVRMKFVKANTFRRYNQFDRALPLFFDILDHHRKHETAEFAANLILDTYNRLGQYDKMLALVDRLASDKQFLAGKDDLVGRLALLRRQAAAKAAEDAEHVGKASKDFAKLVECGQRWLAVYNADPLAADADVMLYNAGVCFAEGKSISSAIQMFTRMQQLFAKSPHTARAVARLGKLYGDVALYKEAAEALETYAKKYAGEKDKALIPPYEAVSEAVGFRKGIGDDARAIDDTKFFIATFGRQRPAEAAAAKFSLTSIYEKQGDVDALVRNLREYIHAYAEIGGGDRLVIAWAKIGQAEWNRSCPVKMIDGTCATVVRERAVTSRRAARSKGELPDHCPGSEQKIRLTVVARDARRVRDALAAFAEAERAYDKRRGKPGGDEAGARYYRALARSTAADVDYEKYLAITLPSNLDFDPAHPATRAKSQQRIDAWFATKSKASLDAAARFASVLELKEPANSIAAAARLAQIAQQFADELYTAEIPKFVRTGAYAEDKIDAYCEVLEVRAIPLADRAVAAYSACLAKSTELGWFSAWSRLCERELGQIKPEEFPTAAELHAAPELVTAIVTPEPPQRLP